MITTILPQMQKTIALTAILLFTTFFSIAQSGPGGVGNSTTNVLWLRSDQGTSTTTDGVAVSSWNDISGNANHASQPNGAKQPTYISSSINGLPALRFAGTNINLVVTDNDNLDNTTGVTIFVVGQPDNIDANPRGLVSKRVSSGDETAYSLFSHTGSNLYLDAPTRMNGTTPVTNSPQVFGAVFNGNDPNFRSRVFQNGSETGSANAGGNTSIGNMASDLFIGILNDNYGDAFRGDMSEVILYRSALNRAERTIVEVYLANRYNIALTTYSYGSTTYNQQLIGIGNVGGERSTLTQDNGSGLLLAESNGSLNADGEFVFAGHDGTLHGIDNSNLPDITPITLTERWQRVFYVERQEGGVINTGSTDVRIGFNYSGTLLPTDPSKIYYLLYRAGTSGTFSVVPGGTGIMSNDAVWFNISNANFSSGYYTIAQSSEEVRAWYSFNDGNWNNYNTWSLNPETPLNPGNEIPGVMDKVVIQASKTVTVTDNDISAGVLEVNSGILNFGTSTGQNFSSISGQPSGTIRLAADNFPVGDASGFADASTGGTVEYYGAGYSLSTSRTFRNMVVNLNNTTDQLVLLSNYTLNGSLTISNGEFHFGNTSTTARNLTVYEHVEVGANGKIRTGTGITRHQLNLYGDFTNYGNVHFTTRTAVNYTVDNANGIVDVNFRSSARNQNMMLEGPTRFYRIAIEKGTATNKLFMEATDPNFFELLGWANQGHPDNPQLTVNNNAFGLAYGEVLVGQNISIDRLNQGGNYNVSENAVLHVDGGSVTKPAGTGEAIVVYGKIKVSSGTFTSNAPSGVTSRLNGVFESAGGTSTISQFRTSIYGTQHIGGYIQTGGDVTINGTAASTNYYSFTLSYEGNAFTLTGGTLTINGTNSKGAIFINSDPVNVNVSASATMNLIATNTTPFRITSRAPLPRVNMSRLGAGDRTFVLEGGSVGTGGGIALLAPQPLVTKGDLTINTNVVFDAKGENVTIGRGYNIGSGASYIAASNTTTFNGATQNYNLFINAGAITKYFHNLTINNSGYTGTLTTSDITVGNNLTISAGALATGAQTITVRGDISNSGTITSTTGRILVTQRGRVHTVNLTNGGSYTSIPTVSFSAGTATAVAIFNGTPMPGTPLAISKIVITDTGSGYTATPTITLSGGGGAVATAVIGTTHELGGNDNGVFGNLEIDEVHPGTLATEVTYLTAKQTVTGIMTLTNGIFDLKTHNLDIEGTLHNNNVAYYSSTPPDVIRFFRTTGNHGDGGLTRTISADGTYLFPIGTINHDNSAYRYAWANPTFSNVTSTGKVQINGVPRKLATLSEDENPSQQRYLSYYWRVRNSGFVTVPNIQNQFLGYVVDFTWNGAHNNHIIGKVINNVRYNDTDHDLGNLLGDVGGTRILDYSVIKILETGEFTAGFKPMFNGSIQIFYSRLFTSDWYALTSNWNNGNNWSYANHEQAVRPAAGDFPKQGDIAIIGYGGHNENGGYHSMNILSSEIVTCADIQFVPNPNPGAFQSRLVLRVTAPAARANLNAGIIQGPGTFMMRAQPNLFPIVSGDFSVFVNEELAVFNYYMETDGDYNIPTGITTEYPNLRIEGGGGTLGNRRATIQEDFLVKRNFTIDQGGEYITNNGVAGDFTVNNYIYLGGGTTPGRLSFNTTGTERTIEVQNIELRNNANNSIRVINTTPSSLEHKIILNDGIVQTNGLLPFYNAGVTANNIILELTSATNGSITVNGGLDPSLYKLVVNKGTTQAPTFTFNNNFTLNAPTNGASSQKALQLQNGKLILNNSLIDLNLSTGGGDFFIPSTAGLVVQQGQVNVSGANNGILLDGLLRVQTGGNINLDGGAGVNNYIEYSASGNATIEVMGGTLTVGSQIRRGTSNSSGILRYTQTGGNVIVGKNAAPVGNRGTFEVLNNLSRFVYTSGTLTVVRPQTGASEASVLLEPAIGSAGNTTIQLGNADTPAASIITLKSTLELGNLIVGGTSTTAQLKDRPIIIKRDLTIGAGCSFSGLDGPNYRNLTVNRHIVNYGTANLNVDTLYLRGNSTSPSAAMQNITGNIRVNQLVVEPEISVSLQPGSGVEVDGDLFINSGQFIDGGNTITLKGNVTNIASHESTNPNAGGILFNGLAVQRIFGTGQFGRLEVNNPLRVQLEGSMTLNNHLTLTNGIFHLQQHRLTLGQNANVLGSGFGENKMVAVYGGAFSPQGLQKNLSVLLGAAPADPYNPAQYSYNFTFPVGSDDGTNRRYMPMDIYIANNSGGGSLRVVPVNGRHITFSDPGQEDHVLRQYWEVTSSGIAQLTALQRNHYTQDAVFGAEADYIGARLYDAQWSKYLESPGPPPIIVVDETNNWINVVHESVNLTSGDYTAGEPDWIPDQVPIFYSKQDGDWTDPNTWERNDGGPVPSNGPVGQIVHIRTAHTVTVTTNFRRAYQTVINGRLELGSTLNHILGYVQGTGTLSVTTSSVPTGNYTDFFGCGGGTMEYGGAGTYLLPDRFVHYNNLTIRGSGTKTMPNLDITICGDLRIEGSVTLKMPGVAAGYRYTDINGDVFLTDNATWDMSIRTWVRLRGDFFKGNITTFTTAYSYQTFYIDGSSEQTFTGNFDSPSWFNNLYFNNPSGFVLNNPASVRTFLYMLNGHIQTTSSSLFTVTRTGGNGLVTYVNGLFEGPVRINLSSGTTNRFLPVGRNGVKKFIYPLDLPTTVGYWTGEYFNTSPTSHAPSMNHENRIAPLQTISQSEYWRITGPSGVASRIRLTLNSTSDIAAGVTNINNLRIVFWNGTNWVIAGGGASVVGPISNGTISTTGTFAFNGTEQFFTLGAVEEVVISTAQITSANAQLCAGGTYQLQLALTGNGPWTIDYTDGTSTFLNVPVPSSPHTITISGMATGSYTYTINAVRDNASVGGFVYGSTPTVTVYALPITAYTLSSAGDICGGTTTSISVSGSQLGFTYQLYRDGSYFGEELIGTGNAITFTGVDQSGTYTVRVFNNSFVGCALFIPDDEIISLGSSASASITQLISPATMCEQEEVTLRLSFNGTPPFTFSLADGQGNTWNSIETIPANLVGTGPTYTYDYTIPTNPVWLPSDVPTVYTYTITSMNDAGGCGVGTITGAGVNVNVYKIPVTGPQYHIPNTFGE